MEGIGFLLSLGVYVLIGACAGFMGGLLGIGGGLVTVPFLYLTFSILGFSPHLMQMAVGTSLGAMIFTSAASAWSHFRQKGVQWHYLTYLLPGIILGSIVGAFIADLLPSQKLKVLFGIFVLLIGIYFLVSKSEEWEIPLKPEVFILNLCGIAIGAISTLLGIGGGVMTVPLLVSFRIPIKFSISTSAVIGFFIALFGALSFLFLGKEKEDINGSFGYLYAPALFIVGLTSTLTASFGAKLTYILHHDTLRRVFGVYLIVTGIVMCF